MRRARFARIATLVLAGLLGASGPAICGTLKGKIAYMAHPHYDTSPRIGLYKSGLFLGYKKSYLSIALLVGEELTCR